MPLARSAVTAASRIMLPAYAVHAAFFGTLYVLNPGGRLDRAPGLALARLIMPMALWGCVLLAAAALLVAAMLFGNRPLAIAVLWGYCATNVIWAGIYAGAPFVTPNASLGGPGHSLLIATACAASAVSLQRREV